MAMLLRMDNDRLRERTLNALGEFTGAFNEVEIGLHLLVMGIVGIEKLASTAAIIRGMRFRDLTGALRRLAETEFVPDEIKRDVLDLCGSADDLNRKRNAMLHSRIWFSPGDSVKFSALHNLLADPGHGIETSEEMTPEDFFEMIDDTLEIRDSIRMVLAQINVVNSDT